MPLPLSSPVPALRWIEAHHQWGLWNTGKSSLEKDIPAEDLSEDSFKAMVLVGQSDVTRFIKFNCIILQDQPLLLQSGLVGFKQSQGPLLRSLH